MIIILCFDRACDIFQTAELMAEKPNENEGLKIFSDVCLGVCSGKIHCVADSPVDNDQRNVLKENRMSESIHLLLCCFYIGFHLSLRRFCMIKHLHKSCTRALCSEAIRRQMTRVVNDISFKQLYKILQPNGYKQIVKTLVKFNWAFTIGVGYFEYYF